MREKLIESESIRFDLIEKMEQDKAKARNMLIKKDINEQRLKMIIVKLESYLKS